MEFLNNTKFAFIPNSEGTQYNQLTGQEKIDFEQKHSGEMLP